MSQSVLRLLARGIFSLVVLSFIAPSFVSAATTAPVSSPFRYTFNVSGTLLEAGSLEESSSPYFWLNSGGKFLIQNGVGKTVQGSLPASDATRLLYATMNPLDTGDGYMPQNTLRLVTRASWKDVQESVRFNVAKVNSTDTPNRDGYSGIFLFGRYKDQHNLYYVGIRHDGQAVIKKKINGTYYTLAEKQVFGNQEDYDRWTHPTLIPEGKWMGLRATFDNLADGSVRVRMYLDNGSGTYSYVLTTIDSGVGGAPLTVAGKAGIRSDYMDIQFDDFEIRNLY